MSSEIPTGLRENLADRYELVRLIARGGMASVYMGRDLKHDRAVAVKVLRPELGALLGAERFLREIKVVARLQHPHILPLYDSGEADEALYYVMPFVPGDSLRDRIRREQRLPLRAALRVAREVADALYYAHSNDIIHRDIKPENILLSGDHAMVADFGIARAVHVAGGERWETLTDSGVAVGTPAYMSPEQTAGDRDLDGRSDIFSLGCVVYEMLAGVPPYTGPDGEVMIARRFTDPAPILRAVREDVPESVDLAVQRALAREPVERFANAREFTDAIWDDTPASMRRGHSGQSETRFTGQQSGARAADYAATTPALPGASRRSAWKVGALAAVGIAAVAGIATVGTLLIVKPRTWRSAPGIAAVVADSGAAQSGAHGAAGDSTSRVAPAAGAASGGPAATPPASDGFAGAPVPTPGVGTGTEAPIQAPLPDRPVEPATRTVPERVKPEPQVRVPVPTAPRTDSVLASLRAAARDARMRAVNGGATAADLSRGDSLERAAETSATEGRVSDAIAQLVSASTAWADGGRAAKSRVARSTTVPASGESAVALPRASSGANSTGANSTGANSAESAVSATTAAPPLADQRAAIEALIVSYGRAIEARDISAIRQLYPGITAAQQRDWQQFFGAVQGIRATLAIAQLDLAGARADARISGTYRYENTSTRRSEEQPVSFRASLQRDGATWRITAIR